ncbi:mannosyl phosphorylinositol ceramide synthase CSH1-like [Lingula anatina]|uniref:Mannosyl phosphorylinositol ceramide synthase CSH1-like n=1 Tax=Lingula anatina TaxID=7574 RepID=A0A1S3KDX7_LINAN|nr:mannosyl phosphorylinositol ceramide synthase CSH1-like [Lingula anatina]XP_013420830.1 mannosyl phosphorylinositol ceramide synthase CSH1-like [Lingula anatina]|eukprot:XP_013420829.1 mannosyl phosphorylinositol ceramide synthase CSH1-like [Lingula anatina]
MVSMRRKKAVWRNLKGIIYVVVMLGILYTLLTIQSLVIHDSTLEAGTDKAAKGSQFVYQVPIEIQSLNPVYDADLMWLNESDIENDDLNTKTTISEDTPSLTVSISPMRYHRRPIIPLRQRANKTLPSGIPMIIHQTWKTRQLPPRFRKWSRSWRRCFPEWELWLWTDESSKRFIYKRYPWFLEKYRSYDQEIKRADAARYFILYHFGGLYVDLDYECLRPFDHLLDIPLVFDSMRVGNKWAYANGTFPYVQNSFMASTKGHPFWMEVIQEMTTRSGDQWPQGATGPYLIMDTLRNYSQSHSDFRIYPPQYFNPFSWDIYDNPYCKDLNAMTDREIDLCKSQYPGAYAISYHTQTWGKGKIL